MTRQPDKPAHINVAHTTKPQESPADLILVGRFGAPHGVRGEIRVKSFTADPLAIARYGDLCNRNNPRRFRFLNARYIKDDMLVARISGIDNRDSAETLVNKDIFVNRSQLPPPEQDEFYLTDLIGLEARLKNGEHFGRVLNVVNFGAGDILEIDVGAVESRMVPFSKAAVPEVEIAAKYIVVEPPVEIDGEA